MLCSKMDFTVQFTFSLQFLEMKKKMFKRKTKKSLFSKSNQNGMVAFSLLKWSMILRTSFWSRYTSTRRQRKFEVNIPPKKALLKQERIEIGFCVVNPTFTICIS